MASLAVSNTFADGNIITAAGPNQNFSDVVNYVNARNSGSTAWDAVKTTDLTTSGTVLIGGTAVISAPTTLSSTVTISGTMAADIPMASHKLTGMSAGASAGDSVRYEQNKVLQVVSATATTTFSTTSNTFQATNLSATITPVSASNKILILISGRMGIGSANHTVYLTVARNTTNILGADGQFDVNGPSAAIETPATLTYLDSPASTSALTYKAYIRNDDNASTATFGGGASQTQHITLIEINGI